MNPMVSHLIVACIVGVASGGIGALVTNLVTNAVQNQRLKSLEKRADKIDLHLERHDTAFTDRVLFKDDLREKCAACSKLDEEQHKNVMNSFTALKKEVTAFKTETVAAFRSCTDDLIKQLRTET